MSARPDFEPRAFLGAIGAGAAVCAVQFKGLLALAGMGSNASLSGLVVGLLTFGAVTWLIAALGFFIGLLFIGIPAWAALAALRWTSRRAAVAAGAVLAALAGVGIASLDARNLPGLWMVAAFFVLPGAVAGWTLHRVAYGRTVRP